MLDKTGREWYEQRQMRPMQTESAEALRAELQRARRIVVKFGTRVLAQSNGRPDEQRMRQLVRQVARVQREGRQIAVVTSGAVGAGMESLGLRRRPRTLPDLQMAAAVGQTHLMSRYHRLFAASRCTIGQVLLTHDGLKSRERHLNARNTLMQLLRHGIIPIINENDAVSVDEIKFGDNDMLAALVGILIEADLLVLFTCVDGLRAPAGRRTRRMPWLPAVTPDALALVSGGATELSTGGMASKLQASDLFAGVGGAVVIADGRAPDMLPRILAGEDVGTLIGGSLSAARLRGKRKWIAFFHRTEGTLIIDSGAADALQRKGTSLLPIGITDVEGDFPAGAVVNVKTRDGTVLAKGLTAYAAADVRRIRGRRTSELATLLGDRHYDEVIHRDNLSMLINGKGVRA